MTFETTIEANKFKNGFGHWQKKPRPPSKLKYSQFINQFKREKKNILER